MAICWEWAVPVAFHLCCFYFSAVLVVRVPFPFSVWGRVWNSIVTVPDHCLFIYLLYAVLCVCVPFPYDIWGRMWNSGSLPLPFHLLLEQKASNEHNFLNMKQMSLRTVEDSDSLPLNRNHSWRTYFTYHSYLLFSSCIVVVYFNRDRGWFQA